MKTKNATEKTMKVCLVGSSGGHLTHLYSEEFDIKTFDKESLDTATRCVLEMLNCKAYLLIYIASRLRKSKQDKLRG